MYDFVIYFLHYLTSIFFLSNKTYNNYIKECYDKLDVPVRRKNRKTMMIV